MKRAGSSLCMFLVTRAANNVPTHIPYFLELAEKGSLHVFHDRSLRRIHVIIHKFLGTFKVSSSRSRLLSTGEKSSIVASRQQVLPECPRPLNQRHGDLRTSHHPPGHPCAGANKPLCRERWKFRIFFFQWTQTPNHSETLDVTVTVQASGQGWAYFTYV
jgi:hypothetical protein